MANTDKTVKEFAEYHEGGVDDDHKLASIQRLLGQVEALRAEDIDAITVCVKAKGKAHSFTTFGGNLRDIQDCIMQTSYVLARQLNENGFFEDRKQAASDAKGAVKQ